MAPVASTSAHGSPSKAITRPQDSPYAAVCWAFFFRFGPLEEDPLWPQSYDEFEIALSASSEPADFGADSKDPYVPSLVPILEWAADNFKPGAAYHWKSWLHGWTAQRLKDTVECRLSELWQGTNRLEQAGDIWALPWQDKLILLKALVDSLLTYAPPIRELINEGYQIVPNRTILRGPGDNPLVCERIGQDSRRRTFWQLDDTALIWESGNPFRASCPLILRTRTEAEVRSFVAALATDKASEHLAPIFKTVKKANDPLADERALRSSIEVHILPRLVHADERMETARERRHDYREELERQQLREIQRQQRDAFNKQRREERESRLRTQQHKVDYVYGSDDIRFDKNLREYQNGAESDGAALSDSEPMRKRRRGTSTEGDDDYHHVDDPEEIVRSARLRSFEPAERRSGRSAALNAPSDYYGVTAEENGRARTTRSRASDVSVRLPKGADPKDYDLASQKDVIVWRGNTSRLIKGALTAQAELAEQLANDARRRVKLLSAGNHVPAGHLPVLPKGANEADYDMTLLEDETVWSRGRPKTLKGALTAAKEVAEALEADARRLIKLARVEGGADEETSSHIRGAQRRNPFGDLGSDAMTDGGSSSSRDNGDDGAEVERADPESPRDNSSYNEVDGAEAGSDVMSESEEVED